MAALGAAFTLRHRIPETSANSLEPYFHPRMLAFGIGLLATAAVLRRRYWLAVALVAGAAVVHVTTAMWFAVLLGVAMAMLDRRMRALAVAAAVVAVAAGLWAFATGRLDASLAPMDATWLQAVATKDSLFPTHVAGLGVGAPTSRFLGLLWWAHRRRVRNGVATAEDAALVWGATALVALFLADAAAGRSRHVAAGAAADLARLLARRLRRAGVCARGRRRTATVASGLLRGCGFRL